ncbi:MAG: hypothetical protein ABI432_07860 [Flavobacteriales bacterium]
MIFTLLFPAMHSSMAQAPTIEWSTAFDFWLGEWQCQWNNAEGEMITGSNSITRIMGGRVIQERFSDPSANFEGMSLTVLDPRDTLWHQAWADSDGSYFDFVGSVDGEHRIFSTHAGTVVQRMVFSDIRADSFQWDWEKSTDGGTTWTLNWRIHYTRKK